MEAPSKNGFHPKQSRANKLWICTLLVVLFVLFLEVHGDSQHHYNFCVSTNAESIGAEVYIDSQKVGAVQ